jgi:hypothetical protein
VRPPGPQQGELHLDVREVGRDEEEAQEEDVVEGDIRRLDFSPGEGRRRAMHPDQAGHRGEAERGSDGPGSDLPMVLLDEKRHA